MMKSGVSRIFFSLIALGVTVPARAAWDSFEIIEWQARNPAQLEALRDIGVSAVATIANRDGTGTPLELQTAAPRAAGLRWYIENIATDFYAPYHRYTPGRPVNWRFLDVQQRYRVDPDDPAALIRDPSLLDPAWRQRIRDRLIDTVGQQKNERPLYYSLGDETGIADLAAYWDFDLSTASLDGFRVWLREHYGSLAALNAEWGTSYRDWTEVRPETTREAMRRRDDNYAPWSDFKSWMDASFAAALRFGTDAVHHADPRALSAIEGVQVPGWGGYDYGRLARMVDVMEIYDGEENLPLIRSLNPDVIPLVTSFGASSTDLHGIWRSVLRGARGLILWDEDNGIVRLDGSVGPRGAAYAPLFAALRGDLGRRLLAARPIYDSVAMLYSPTSFRLGWMLDHRSEGDAWAQRSAEIEVQDNAWRASMRTYNEALVRRGLHPRFITEAQLADEHLIERVLILPRSIAMSDAAVRGAAGFAARGGTVIADVPPGEFDGHGKRRAMPPKLASIVPPDRVNDLVTAVFQFGEAHIRDCSAATAGDLIVMAGLVPAIHVFVCRATDVDGHRIPGTSPGTWGGHDDASTDIETYLFRDRDKLLLALQPRSPAVAPVPVTLDLGGRQARDLSTGRTWHGSGPSALTLDPITPSILEISR